MAEGTDKTAIDRQHVVEHPEKLEPPDSKQIFRGDENNSIPEIATIIPEKEHDPFFQEDQENPHPAKIAKPEILNITTSMVLPQSEKVIQERTSIQPEQIFQDAGIKIRGIRDDKLLKNPDELARLILDRFERNGLDIKITSPESQGRELPQQAQIFLLEHSGNIIHIPSTIDIQPFIHLNQAKIHSMYIFAYPSDIKEMNFPTKPLKMILSDNRLSAQNKAELTLDLLFSEAGADKIYPFFKETRELFIAPSDEIPLGSIKTIQIELEE